LGGGFRRNEQTQKTKTTERTLGDSKTERIPEKNVTAQQKNQKKVLEKPKKDKLFWAPKGGELASSQKKTNSGPKKGRAWGGGKRVFKKKRGGGGGQNNPHFP